MALRALFPSSFRSVLYFAYGVHEWDDLLEKLVRTSPIARSILRRIGRYPPAKMRRRYALFVHVPKNAGTTIASALYGSWIGHRTALFCQASDPAFFRRSTRFAVLRDPVDRFISAYWFLRNGGGSDRKVAPWFARSCRDVSSIDDLISHVENRIDNVYELDNVIRPQIWFLQDNAGELLIDTLFVLGTDDARLGAFLRDRYGVSKLQRLNQTQKSHLALTDQQRERILAIYAADAELVQRMQRANAQRLPASPQPGDVSVE
jgi:hypothetical protein